MTTPKLTSRRFVLDPLLRSDAAELFRYRSSPEVREFQGWVPETVGDAERFIDGVRSVGYDTPETWSQFAIRDSESGLIGDLGVHFGPADSQDVEIGVTVAPEQQRRGVARESLTRVFDHLFEDLEKRRVLAVALPENRAVLALLWGLGMSESREESYPRWYRQEAIDGVWLSLSRAGWLER